MRAPRDPARRGLLRSAAFFALLGAAGIGTDALVSRGLRRLRTGTFGVWNRIVAGDIGSDIVVSGSSRALNHYDPRVLTQATGLSAFNIGLNGSYTDMQLARLRVYLRHNRPPRLLIHNLDLHSLQASPGEVFDPAQYLPYLDEPALQQALRHIDPATWKWRLPLYGYAVQDMRLTWLQGLGGALGWQPEEDHAAGFLPQRREWTEAFERWRARAPAGVLAPVQEAGAAALEGLLELCRLQGVPLLLVYSPEHVAAQRQTLNRGAIFARFAEFAQRHGATLWDYSDHPLSQEARWFVNSQHLNATGAQAFSQALGERLARCAGWRDAAG